MLAAPSCAPAGDFEANASAEQAASDYATGILTGDTELASKATGVQMTAEEVAAARVEILGVDEAVPGATVTLLSDPEVVASRDGEEDAAIVFTIESYETPDGESVAVSLDEGSPEVWVTGEAPWRVMRSQDQTTAMWFVIVVLLVGFAIVGTVVVVLIRIANRAGVGQPTAE